MRQFVSDSTLENGCVCVEGKKFRYLASVLRVEEGDMIDVRLPGGTLQPMTVAKVDRGVKKIMLQVAGDMAGQSRGVHARAAQGNLFPYELWLFQFVAKPPKMDLIIRQAVECGVSRIIPVEGAFCQKGSIESARKKTDGSDDRWQRVITEAREQSGSPVETLIMPSMSVEKACELYASIGEEKQAVVLYERSDGTVSIKGEVVSMEILEGKIASMRQSFPNMTFLLLIDPDCPYQHVIDMIHSVRICGVENFSFRMEDRQ